VLFISGLGRSGSTLLELLLSGLPGVVSLGEVKHLWERGLRDNDLCGCGTPFHDCPFWREVGERAFGGWSRVDPHSAIAAARAADRHRQLPEALVARSRRRSALARYGGMLYSLFDAVQALTGAELIVDASKDPPHGFVLRSVPGLDVRVVHLVRDSRGVAFSWRKVVARPGAAAGQLMTRMSPLRSGLMWVDVNLLTEALGGLGTPLVRVRYEDLAAHPQEQLRRVAALAGVGTPPTGPPAPARPPGHGIGGNPIRFRDETVDVRADDAWVSGLPAGERRLVTALTAVLLRRYGYSLPAPRTIAS
jgi:hypothetical protein